MVPLEILSLPRPLDRFGTAFPSALADLYANAYAPRRGVVLDPLAHPWSAADAAERADRRGVAKSRDPLGEWARRAIALAPSGEDIIAALDRVGESALVGTPHRVAMRELYGSICATCRGPVVVEAFLWERDAPTPTKKAFRCGICAREGRALLIEAATEDDERSSQRLEQRGMAYWQFVERFGPAPTLRDARPGHRRRRSRAVPGAGRGRLRRLERGRRRRAPGDPGDEADRRRRWSCRRARTSPSNDARRTHRWSSRIASGGAGRRIRAARRPDDDRRGRAGRRGRGLPPARHHVPARRTFDR